MKKDISTPIDNFFWRAVYKCIWLIIDLFASVLEIAFIPHSSGSKIFVVTDLFEKILNTSDLYRFEADDMKTFSFFFEDNTFFFFWVWRGIYLMSGSEAGCGGIKPASSIVIQNYQSSLVKAPDVWNTLR